MDIKRYIDDLDDLKQYGWSDLSLREYQMDGVNWMIDRYHKKHGFILGDEMGLGKTCQTIAVISYLHSKSEKKSPNLVVCPRSVLENWEQEIKKFAPGLKSQVYIGEKESRQELGKQIVSDYKHDRLKFDVLITTYEICIKDASTLQKLHWHLLVVDEAHRLKNINSLLYKTLSEWDTHTSILLTGTPVQNNLQELYALLSFISPRKFPARELEDFVEKFSKLKKNATEIHSVLQPFLLLRTKAEVLKDLPQKEELVLQHGVSKLQVKLYRGILLKDTELFDQYSSYGGMKQTTSLMNILMQLRKCVNHPYLFDGVEPEPFQLGEHLIEASGKLVVIDKLLKYLSSTGHKVLMFSQMTHMLDILQDYLGYRGYSYERLDGSVRGEERFLAVRNFNENDETFVFLLSTRAGGVGINLTSADTVIFVDSDFNPQNDIQAAARAHRIGQTRPVKIIRLIGKNTVEEIILQRAKEKLKLTDKVIKEGNFSLGATKQSMFTDDKVKLQDILKYGVGELFGDQDEDDMDEDFVKILGPTADGEWQTAEEEENEGSEPQGESTTGMEEGGTQSMSTQSMYMFEGTDYSKEPSSMDVKAFDELIAVEKAAQESQLTEDRPLRMKRQTTAFMGGLPDVLRTRKKLSPEEREERRKKMKEKAERRAKEAEEQELKRAQDQRKRREELWKKNGYESLNIVINDEEEEEEDEEQSQEEEEDDAGETTRRDINYVMGDVTLPKDTDRDNNIVIHCTDDSGSWGRGGLFTAISNRSPLPENHYTTAGKMKDLALGDCHLIPIDDVKSRPDGNDWLALIVAQHRDKHNKLSGIKLSALRYGLERVYHVAKEKKASVHLPRIGHDTPAFNWYGTERLIKKHLASKGIPTYIYYFPRKRHQKRKHAGTDPSTQKVIKGDPSTQPSTSNTSSPGTSLTSLVNIFSGTKVYLHQDGMADYKKYKRFIVAYDGDVEPTVTESSTHIVVATATDTKVVAKLSEDNPDVPIVTSEWIDDCLSKKSCLKTQNYELT